MPRARVQQAAQACPSAESDAVARSAAPCSLMLRVATAQVRTAQGQVRTAPAESALALVADLPALEPEPVVLASEPPATESRPAAARASELMSVPAALELAAGAPEWCLLAPRARPASVAT